MNTSSGSRVTAGLAIVGAAAALVGNALSPRINGDGVDIYHKVAHSSRYEVAGFIVFVALTLVIAAFVGLSRSEPVRGHTELSEYARLAAVVGGAIALAQGAVQLYGYRQEARAFDSANAHNVVSAFWATNALDHLNAGMFAMWTIFLLGVTPVLLGVAQLRSRSRGLGAVAVAGGAICVIVGIGELLKSDQSTFDIPFAIGSVLVTLWLLGTGVVTWRHAAEIDLTTATTSTVTPSVTRV